MYGEYLFPPTTINDMCHYLNVSKNTLYYWMKDCVPKEWKFNKIHKEYLPYGIYVFSNEDYHIFQICKKLKETMTATEVRKELEIFIKKKIDNGEWREKINIS